MTVVGPRYVHEDLVAMPDDGRRRELLEGDLLVRPSPSRRHQRTVSNRDTRCQHLEGRDRG